MSLADKVRIAQIELAMGRVRVAYIREALGAWHRETGYAFEAPYQAPEHLQARYRELLDLYRPEPGEDSE